MKVHKGPAYISNARVRLLFRLFGVHQILLPDNLAGSRPFSAILRGFPSKLSSFSFHFPIFDTP